MEKVELSSQMTISEVIAALESGKEIDNIGLWYDWFCKSRALVNRGKKLLTKLKVVVKANAKNPNPKFNPDETYVFFKNNCPLYGSLYDDFRICDIETGDVLYTITPSSGYCSNKGTAELYGKENDFKEPLVSGEWKDIVKFFKEN